MIEYGDQFEGEWKMLKQLANSQPNSLIVLLDYQKFSELKDILDELRQVKGYRVKGVEAILNPAQE